MSKGILFLHSLELHMQLNTKNFLAILLLGVATIYFYYGFRGGETSTQTNTQKPTVSAEIIETDTGKRLETYANSGTDWGMTPFGSGKPLTEAEKEKPQFVKPNTEWKTRTISGVTYVFGEGNPREVALSQTELENLRKKCGSESDPNNLGYLCKETDGYVSPGVEKYLLDALSDPNWETLLTECKENLTYNEEFFPSESEIANNQNGITFSTIVNSDFLDIENWIYIDHSGRKTIDFKRLHAFQEWLSAGFEVYWKQREWPIHPDGTKWIFKNPTCVDTYGADILRNLVLARVTYLNAGQEL